jgi:hypothetical protein
MMYCEKPYDDSSAHRLWFISEWIRNMKESLLAWATEMLSICTQGSVPFLCEKKQCVATR